MSTYIYIYTYYVHIHIHNAYIYIYMYNVYKYICISLSLSMYLSLSIYIYIYIYIYPCRWRCRWPCGRASPRTLMKLSLRISDSTYRKQVKQYSNNDNNTTTTTNNNNHNDNNNMDSLGLLACYRQLRATSRTSTRTCRRTPAPSSLATRRPGLLSLSFLLLL